MYITTYINYTMNNNITAKYNMIYKTNEHQLANMNYNMCVKMNSKSYTDTNDDFEYKYRSRI